MLLGAVAGVVLCGAAFGIGSLLGPHTADPSLTGQTLCGDLTSQNYTALYGLLSARQRALGTQAQFVASQRQLDALRGRASQCGFSLAGQDSASAELALTVTRGSAGPLSSDVRLLLDGSSWHVDTFDGGVVSRDARPNSV
jgi:hypothetical protein